jgi:hypothetical protein
METRAKWVESPEIDSSVLKELSREVQSRLFTNRIARGFLIDSIRPRSIAGKFIERIEGTRLVADPFGTNLELPYVTFETVNFRIYSEFPQFEFVNAPRSLVRFTNFISEILEVSFSLKPILIDPLVWGEKLTVPWGKMSVSELRSDNLNISQSLSADITLSGNGDILNAAQKYFSPRPLVPSIINASFGDGDNQLNATLSNIGSCKVALEPQDRRFPALRDALQRAAHPKT